MKLKLVLLITATVFTVSESRAQVNKNKQVMVAAHRGDWRNAPENSLQAVRKAIEMGVDMVEVDLAITKDGVVVIMHDSTIDRTTNGTGQPSDYTFAEIRKFRLKNGLGRITSHVIPSLGEVMLAAKEGKIWINLDKSTNYYTEAFEVCKRTGTLKQALFKTELTYPELSARYGALLDSIVFMPMIRLGKPGSIASLQEYIAKMHPFATELIFDTDTSSILKHPEMVTKSGTRIWINSLWASLNAGHDDDKAVDSGNKKDSWDWILEHGATMIQTDRPSELLAYLRSKRLHK